MQCSHVHKCIILKRPAEMFAKRTLLSVCHPASSVLWKLTLGSGLHDLICTAFLVQMLLPFSSRTTGIRVRFIAAKTHKRPPISSGSNSSTGLACAPGYNNFQSGTKDYTVGLRDAMGSHCSVISSSAETRTPGAVSLGTDFAFGRSTGCLCSCKGQKETQICKKEIGSSFWAKRFVVSKKLTLCCWIHCKWPT